MKNKIFIYSDKILLSFLLFHAFGKIGCFLAGCCYGKETECIFSIQNNSGIYLHPVQLYESAMIFTIFIFFLINNSKWWSGKITALYLVFYGFDRFIAEFFRADSIHYVRMMIYDFSISQIITMVLIIVGTAFYYYLNSNRKIINVAAVS